MGTKTPLTSYDQRQWLKRNVPFFFVGFIAAAVVPSTFFIPAICAICTFQLWVNLGA